MRKIAFLSLLLFAACGVNAQTALEGYKIIETWLCYSQTDHSKKNVLVLLTREKLIEGNRETGVVKVAGTNHVAEFAVKGFDRRWDFGPHDYAFIISPDGEGRYYDFTMSGDGDTVRPRQFYDCVMK